MTFERDFFTYFENLKNYLRIQPLTFAGVPGPSGGTGGPPGGIIGQLPQSAITLDLTEAEIWPIPPSGTSLVDNLNRIRYRIAQVEASGGGGGTGPGTITIYNNGEVVASGITTVDIRGTEILVTTSGEVATITHPAKGIDNWSVMTGTSQFTTTYPYLANSLGIYYNGLKQFDTEFTEIAPGSGIFTTSVTIPSGAYIVADYLYYESFYGGFGENPWDEGPWG